MNKSMLNYGTNFANPPSEAKLHSSPLMSWLSNRWSAFVQILIKNREPRVWQKQNAAGETYYRAFDSYSGRSAYLTSDTELRSWLEKLPYQ